MPSPSMSSAKASRNDQYIEYRWLKLKLVFFNSTKVARIGMGFLSLVMVRRMSLIQPSRKKKSRMFDAHLTDGATSKVFAAVFNIFWFGVDDLHVGPCVHEQAHFGMIPEQKKIRRLHSIV